MQVTKSAHSLYCLKYHVVWVCKYRRKILKPGVCSYIRKTLPSILRSMPGVEIETIGFDLDHLHMVIIIPPKYSIAEVMGRLKSQLASRMRKFFGWLDKVYWKENVVWSPGYFVSSIGLDEDVIRNYVELQGQQDLGQLKLEL
ncbi:transposase IS200-family protein [Denitrovibrio acetiphilus DSM 12809]|uniref:Transposase IS200-family protein n=1 Tax=Denitrovibrio acetiphilus (strain DSM 12809 / NBRC 114555 / N2460) TaxID=522772 RepID=D4H6Q2_DENA2|nr:IS200/IS605 family transposase [Denitrovibrio acetiphilus]ADD67768.1 transposase IS200-family protein [Denitrovibrio acetiphilus DSM 12809]